MTRTVAIVPAGQWGTALAVPIARGGHRVRLWFRSSAAADRFNKTRQNERRLPGIALSDHVTGTADIHEALKGADIVVLACSSAGLADTCRAVAPALPDKAILLSLVKSLFAEEPRFVSEFVAQRCSVSRRDADVAAMRRRVAVLSGPNFAIEVARELPAGTTVAAADPAVADFLQTVLMTDRFRVWTSTDVIGVQLGGALKNIIAIGAGISDGLGLGDNARAVLVTRGVAEITRLGVALGANPLTFAGVSGIGDIMLTCTGGLSRNRAAGLAIAQGTPPATYIRDASETRGSAAAGPEAPEVETADGGEETFTTVEGIATTKAAYRLALELGIDMPITHIIYRILYEGLPPKDGMHLLMTRAAKAELPGPGPWPVNGV